MTFVLLSTLFVTLFVVVLSVNSYPKTTPFPCAAVASKVSNLPSISLPSSPSVFQLSLIKPPLSSSSQLLPQTNSLPSKPVQSAEPNLAGLKPKLTCTHCKKRRGSESRPSRDAQPLFPHPRQASLLPNATNNGTCRRHPPRSTQHHNPTLSHPPREKPLVGLVFAAAA